MEVFKKCRISILTRMTRCPRAWVALASDAMVAHDLPKQRPIRGSWVCLGSALACRHS
jgi:hypothetical protein